MSEGELLELLSFYQEMTETQNELIFRLSRLVKKQAEELTNLRGIMRVEADERYNSDMGIAMEVLQDYTDSMEP